MKNVIKHKLPATHEEWLDNRLKGVGGSDAGSVLGLNKYKSAYALWCEKTGRIHKNIDNERMRFGRDAEAYVPDVGKKKLARNVERVDFHFNL
jgi:predicted phage-related endonuclease